MADIPDPTSGSHSDRWDAEVPVDRVEAQVRAWLADAADEKEPQQAKMLADVLSDPQGLDFTTTFVDRVVRPEDPATAAAALRAVAEDPPGFLTPALRAAVVGGSAASRLAPAPVVATARAALRRLVGHLVLDSRDPWLGRSIRRLRADGTNLNLNLLGESVQGHREAAKRLEGISRLLARPDVDYVSVKPSAVVPHPPLWGARASARDIADTLLPLFRQAAASETTSFINLDMEEYRDVELTLDVFERVLDTPGLEQVQAGIVLQAYLPDALPALERLQEWSARRVDRGGAPIKIRVVKGANIEMEHVEAGLHGWPLATFGSKEATDAHYKRVLDAALTPASVRSIRVGLAGHNLFDIAHHLLLARSRGVSDSVEVEMLAGMAAAQTRAVARTAGAVRLYVPVVRPDEFDVAVSYLVRRLEESAAPQNFLATAHELDSDESVFQIERDRYLTTRALASLDVAPSFRAQDRSAGTGTEAAYPAPGAPPEDRPQAGTAREPTGPLTGFANAPDTDLATRANQQWAEALTARIGSSGLADQTLADASVPTPEAVDTLLGETVAAATSWAAVPGADRASILRRAAELLEERRGDLLVVAAEETDKVFEQTDPEVSEAIDFCRAYALTAEHAGADPELAITPRALTLVCPPWNFPVAIPCGGVAASLAAGSAVVFKPAPQARRCAAVIAEALWEAGVPRDVLRLADVPEDAAGKALISDDRVDQIVLTGGAETAAMFRRWNPRARLVAETSGKNSIIVTPSADMDHAARDVAASAFGHAGQKCSAASLVILVGSAGSSPRFDRQLADAVHALRVGYPTDPQVQMSPVVEAPGEKLASGLTELGDGERWLAEPTPLDDSGRLFSPGVRDHVVPGSAFHRTEYFGPILGIVRVTTLDEAIEVQNGTAYGLTAGLHSLDHDETVQWLRGVRAGNLYVNRGITGAIVGRQPFGGWKRSSVGATVKAGTPRYPGRLLSWSDAPGHGAGDDGEAWLAAADRSDALAVGEIFGTTVELQGHAAEQNLFRHVPAAAAVRAAEGAGVPETERVLRAALALGGGLDVLSVAHELEDADRRALHDRGVRELRCEDDAAFAAALRGGDLGSARVRLIGSDEQAAALRTALAAGSDAGAPSGAGAAYTAFDPALDVSVWDGPVTASGALEILPFVQEQSVSITNHRYGLPLRDAVAASELGTVPAT